MESEYGITAYDADVLASVRENADFFERAAKACDSKLGKTVCNWFMTEVLALVTASKKQIGECNLTPEALAELVSLIDKRTINGPTAKELLPELFEKGGMPKAIVEARGLAQVSDTGALEEFVKQAIAANPKSVADYKAGKKAALGFFVGQVMKLSKGKADPRLVGELVSKELDQ